MSFLWTVSTILISIAASRLHFRRLTARKGTVVAVVIVFIVVVAVVLSKRRKTGYCAFAACNSSNQSKSDFKRIGIFHGC